MAEEKRQTPRIPPFVTPCRYVLGAERVSAFLSDLSARGGRIHTEVEPPGAGAALVVELRLAGQATHARFPGVVRWGRHSARGGFVFGVRFDGVGPREQGLLEKVVEEFRRRAASIA